MEIKSQGNVKVKMKIESNEMLPDIVVDKIKPKKWWLGLDGVPSIKNGTQPVYFDNIVASVHETVTVRIGDLSLSFSSDGDTPIQLLDLEKHDKELVKEIEAVKNIKIGDEIEYIYGTSLKRGVVIGNRETGPSVCVIQKGDKDFPFATVSKDVIRRNFGQTEFSKSLAKYISGGEVK